VNKGRAWAEVDLQSIGHNRAELARTVGPGVRIMGVVKADAYGHGIKPIARKLASLDSDRWFGVATVSEAWEVRQAVPDARIVVLAPTLPSEAEDVVACRATPVLSGADGALALANVAAKSGVPLPVHVEVDTGMGRSGVLPDELDGLIERTLGFESLRIEALMTHFPDAEGRPDQAVSQTDMLRRCAERLKTRFGLSVMLHAANSAAAIAVPESRLDMVRPGMAMYGLAPALADHIAVPDLQPALSLYARVALVRDLPQGHAVSYAGTYVLPRRARIATVSIGYGDGYPRALGNRGSVIVRGRRVPIVGRVCMDQLMVDVSDVAGVAAGDIATLIGRDGGAAIRAEELARLIGTTEHAITTCLTSRIPRNYIGVC